MKTQSSLEVPKQIRSASFDEMQLGKRQDDGGGSSSGGGRDTRTNSSSSSACSSTRLQERRRSATLKVPQMYTSQRSKSFDAYSGSSGSSSGQQLLSSSFERPETPIIQVSGCYHCACVEEYRTLWLGEDISREEVDEADSGTDLSENESDHEDESRREGSPEITVTLTSDDDMQNESSCVMSPTAEVASELNAEIKVEFPERQRRRSLSRQEALTTFPLELPAILAIKETETIKTSLETMDDDDDDEENDVEPSKSKFIVRDIFLTVPELKRDRAASVDSCFNNNKNGSIADAELLAVPQQNIRSKSVDIVLPTDTRTRYTALLPGKESRPSIGWVRLIDGAARPASCACVSRDALRKHTLITLINKSTVNLNCYAICELNCLNFF